MKMTTILSFHRHYKANVVLSLMKDCRSNNSLNLCHMRITITIRFYEELNDFLEPGCRKLDISVKISKNICVGSLINSLGVPCSAVDLILINGQSVNLDQILQNNDRVSVYPVFERLNIESVSHLNNAPLRKLKFICDRHLGRLAKYLRMLGLDTLYRNDYNFSEIIRLANAHHRILLSRNKKFLLNKKITRRYLVIQTDPVEQIHEVVEFFDLKNQIMPLSRCLKCNGIVTPISRKNVKHRVDQNIFRINTSFSECKGCGRVYWKGSHYDSMMKWIKGHGKK